MIFVDTNIIIDFWRNPTKEVIEIFRRNEIATSGIVLAELLHGARSEKEIHKIMHALSGFSFYEIKHDDWYEIGMMLNKLRKVGLKIPFQDVMLAFIAISNHLLFWTKDKHFAYIKTHFKSLQLYSL
ncbi:MAG: PIN domain-containing protein [Thermotogota bacterium]|nr:PIN domain-containing protein [Thermotogota bacterium]